MTHSSNNSMFPYFPPGVGFVEKRGENLYCTLHETFVNGIIVIDPNRGSEDVGCALCLVEELGADGIVEAVRVEEGESPVDLSADFCEDAACTEAAEGKCLKCGGRFCHEHLYGDRCWCDGCYEFSMIDLDIDDEEILDSTLPKGHNITPLGMNTFMLLAAGRVN